MTSRPNRSAVVTLLGPEAILELFEMRSVLEGFCFRIATEKVTSDQLDDIGSRIEALKKAQSDLPTWSAMHDELHEYICSFSTRHRLIENVRHLRHAVLPYIRLYLSTHESAEMQGFEHETLLKALAAGEPEASEKVMREHVMSAAMGVVDFVQSRHQPAK